MVLMECGGSDAALWVGRAPIQGGVSAAALHGRDDSGVWVAALLPPPLGVTDRAACDRRLAPAAIPMNRDRPGWGLVGRAGNGPAMGVGRRAVARYNQHPPWGALLERTERMLLGMWYTGLIYLALIVLIALLVIAMIIGYELLRRDFRRLSQSNNVTEGLERTLLLQEQIGELKQQVQSAAQAGQKELGRLWRKTDESLSERMQRTGDLVSQVRQSLAGVNETSQRIYQIGAQLAGLGEALRLPPPGAIGGGELWLADLLGQMLPPQHYQLNAALSDGRAIDAVVRLGDYLVAIDAGFAANGGAGQGDAGVGPATDPATRAALQQHARNHVDRVAADCIRPDRGTVDFALMYLPSEGLYYELVVRNSGRTESISNYALARRVIPVSPNTLYAYLYTIVQGLRGLQIEQHAEQIMARLGRLAGQFERFQGAFRALGTHLDRAAGKYDQASRRLDRFADGLTEALPAENPEGLPGGRADLDTELDGSPETAPAGPAPSPSETFFPEPEEDPAEGSTPGGPPVHARAGPAEDADAAQPASDGDPSDPAADPLATDRRRPRSNSPRRRGQRG